MQIESHPFETTDWDTVPTEEHIGETGKAYWQVLLVGKIRIRKVAYSPNYLADHWCNKGHIILCLSGEMETELEDGRKFKLEKGMTYQVGDKNEAHRTFSALGCQLFIVD